MRLKQLELWWRRLWIRLLVGAMRRPRDGRPDWASRPHRVLFLRHDRAGDMILSTGVMRAIARSYPTIALDVLASPANASILDGADYVQRIIVFDKKRIASYLPTALRLRRNRYDAVIDCMVTAPSVTTLLLVAASGARQRVGIAGRGNDAAFTITVPPDDRPNAHMVDLLGALARAFGVELDAASKRPVLVLADAERKRAEVMWNAPADSTRVLVNISAGTGERTWPDDNYAAVIRHILERDARAVVRIISAPNDRARGERIAAASGAALVPTPRIRDAFAMVASANFVLTPDTSITHAASAFRVPTVAIFVKGKAERWSLYDTPGQNVEHDEQTLASLSTAQVLRAVDEVFDQFVERGGVGNAALRETR
jgi:ADP-heptose:LPS heptosyltransferase